VGALLALAGVAVVAATSAGMLDLSTPVPAVPVGASLVGNPPSGASTPVIGGGKVTFGLQTLTLRRGAAPIELLGIELVDAHGLDVVGARLAGPDRPVYQFVSTARFPPVQYNPVSSPAVGTTLGPAKRGYDLLLGLQVSPGGYALMHGIRVEYRVSGQTQIQQQTFPTTFVACTERSQLSGKGCRTPARLRQ
jgi:hypothetical protein